MIATIEKSVICLCKSLIFCNFTPIKKHDMAQPETSVDQQQSFASEAEELAYLRQRVSMLVCCSSSTTGRSVSSDA